ncbi:uncharacterized protein LOC100832283 [Brachypodium distachyon]|uniref:Uncharacterized protein n=1 Tax=Brachypodium distachyon TaxID=15368 RepID=A0A0Q3PJD7_BRADI|nr:uncharacterized protein LOC100832283 [Brachypodium distachyon]KQJ89473.1 hypothetical protein BRADI_4g25917v3 [Brachypodium distachyon]|eukprot:XP_003577853.2 uncharacterized protein LOC100832283 [Brachypodium distachyon]
MMAYRRKQQGAIAAADDRRSTPQPQAPAYNYTSMDSMREPKLGLWGALARKAKGMLDEDGVAHKFEDYGKGQTPRKSDSFGGAQAPQSRWSFEDYEKTERSEPRKRSEALAASVNQLGGRIKNALEEGLTIVDNKTSNIIEETKKIQIRRKPTGSGVYMQNPAANTFSPPSFSQNKAEASTQETQLKASRDVANAMAAKAKLVLRELKTVKADLAFAKQRCAQLEEENKMLRETKQKGVKTEEDDDLIRMQLETLLAEKSRLAQENSMYARENRFLREIVDFHQYTAHDVVSFGDDDTKDRKPEEDSNHSYSENMFPVVEAYLAQEEVSPVPSRSESPILRPMSPGSCNSVGNAPNSLGNALKPNESVPDKD